MSSEQVATDVVAEPTGPAPAPESNARAGGLLRSRFLILIVAVIALDIAAFVLFPPFPRDGAPGDPVPSRCASSKAAWSSRLRTPSSTSRPTRMPIPRRSWSSIPVISNTILTMWIVMAIVLVGAILMVRGRKLIPGRGQNLFEWVYECLEQLRGRHRRAQGAAVHPDLRRVLPAHPLQQLDRPGAAGRQDPAAPRAVERRQHHHRDGPGQLRDLPHRGFRHLGVRGYLGKFFPFGEFRKGVGAGSSACSWASSS